MASTVEPPAVRRRLPALAVAVAAGLALAETPGTAGAFSPSRATNLSRTPRWSAEPYRGTGLHDGIQVAIATDLGPVLGATPEEIPAL